MNIYYNTFALEYILYC